MKKLNAIVISFWLIATTIFVFMPMQFANASTYTPYYDGFEVSGNSSYWAETDTGDCYTETWNDDYFGTGTKFLKFYYQAPDINSYYCSYLYDYDVNLSGGFIQMTTEGAFDGRAGATALGSWQLRLYYNDTDYLYIKFSDYTGGIENESCWLKDSFGESIEVTHSSGGDTLYWFDCQLTWYLSNNTAHGYIQLENSTVVLNHWINVTPPTGGIQQVTPYIGIRSGGGTVANAKTLFNFLNISSDNAPCTINEDDILPPDTALNQPYSPTTLSVNISDYENTTNGWVHFYRYIDGGADISIYNKTSQTFLDSGSDIICSWDTDESTYYEWYVVYGDGYYYFTSSIFNFTTATPFVFNYGDDWLIEDYEDDSNGEFITSNPNEYWYYNQYEGEYAYVVSGGFDENASQHHVKFYPIDGEYNSTYVQSRYALMLDNPISIEYLQFDMKIVEGANDTDIASRVKVIPLIDSLYNESTGYVLSNIRPYFHTSFSANSGSDNLTLTASNGVDSEILEFTVPHDTYCRYRYYFDVNNGIYKVRFYPDVLDNATYYESDSMYMISDYDIAYLKGLEFRVGDGNIYTECYVDNVLFYGAIAPHGEHCLIFSPSPEDNEEDVPIPIYLSVNVYDSDSDFVDIYFWIKASDESIYELVGIDTVDFTSNRATKRASVMVNRYSPLETFNWYVYGIDRDGNSSSSQVFYPPIVNYTQTYLSFNTSSVNVPQVIFTCVNGNNPFIPVIGCDIQCEELNQTVTTDSYGQALFNVNNYYYVGKELTFNFYQENYTRIFDYQIILSSGVNRYTVDMYQSLNDELNGTVSYIEEYGILKGMIIQVKNFDFFARYLIWFLMALVPALGVVLVRKDNGGEKFGLSWAMAVTLLCAIWGWIAWWFTLLILIVEADMFLQMMFQFNTVIFGKLQGTDT